MNSEKMAVPVTHQDPVAEKYSGRENESDRAGCRGNVGTLLNGRCAIPSILLFPFHPHLNK